MMLYQKFHLFLCFLIVMVFFLALSLKGSSQTIEMEIMSFYDTSLTVKFVISFEILIFVFTVLSIFTSVFYYSLSYMSSDPYIKRFLLILFSFAISMMILITSGNMFTSLVGWEGLGITSLLLIMYYCSKSSLKASIYTFLVNRFGDCFFLIMIMMLFCLYPTLDVTLYDSKNQDSAWILGLMLMILAITKSAQFPFSSWLTKAMEAPTPVSSLVHSSTLVTAGIYMLYSYNELWQNESLKTFLLILSVSTLFMSSVCGLVEKDLKKIVAFSTLSQLGFIFFLLSMDIIQMGFFYLIIHAFFKALMFMSSGYIIHHSSGWQDIRKMVLNYSCSPVIVKFFYISSMSLCGMPFLAGFFSKDLILDKIMSSNYPMSLTLILISSFTFTIFYCIRVCWYMSNGMKSHSMMSDQDILMIKSCIFLFLLSCIMGSILMWFYPPTLLSIDSPKIGLLIYLTLMGLVMWNFPVVFSSFFLKTMFYIFVIYNYLATLFNKIWSKLLWYNDLLGIVGNFLKKFPILSSKKITLKMFSIDFFIASFALTMMYFFI